MYLGMNFAMDVHALFLFNFNDLRLADALLHWAESRGKID